MEWQVILPGDSYPAEHCIAPRTGKQGVQCCEIESI